MAVSANEKRYLIIGAVAVAGYLGLRYYENAAASTGSSTAGTTASDAAGTDQAALAGQEQSDVAGLQAQEQSDVQTLEQGLGAETSQEQVDNTTNQGLLAGLESQFSTLTDSVSSLASTVAGFASNTAGANSTSAVPAAASGAAATSRVGTITTNKGGLFYNYWVKVVGTPPPTTVAVNNPIYVAWQKGTPAKSVSPGGALAGVKGLK